MKVRIFNWQPLEKPYRTMRGSISVEIPEIGIILPECTVHSSDGRYFWLHLPSKKKPDGTGKEPWVRTFAFTDIERDTEFRAAVDDAFRGFQEEQDRG